MLNSLDTAYARALISLEIKQYTSTMWTPDETIIGLRNYANSTNNRLLFCMVLTRAAFDGVSITPSDVVNELGISRNAVDTMVKETEEAGWITVERDQNQYRKLIAKPVMVKAYLAYATALADASQELDLAGLNQARKHAKLLGLYEPNSLPL
tara:strand:- start:1845 stop:2303 length:459 start_codon:yes stop_codon:yes gene_type:complete